MYAVLLPPGVNPIAVKYISYQICVILIFQGYVKDYYILLELQISSNTLEHGGSKRPETSVTLPINTTPQSERP
jgi:hypothetical protein